jgi:hypothetical protein
MAKRLVEKRIRGRAIPEKLVDQIELWNSEDASELTRPTDLKKYEITVASRDWTGQTIVSQIDQGHIDLDPAFQRRNAWRDHRRSRLVESFILGFPVPQIVLAENPRCKGTFIVIDGKQRLMTVAGMYLEAYRAYWTQARFSGLDVLKDLNRVTLEDFFNRSEYAHERRQLGNADIRTTVITGFRDEGVLYDIFYRINTGSVPLSSQELRQVLNRGGFAKFLLEITGDNNPLWRVLGIETPDSRLQDVELLLRLVAWRRFSSTYRGNMKPFLDEAMTNLNRQWGTEEQSVRNLIQEIFIGVDVALDIFGEELGRKWKAGQYERALNRALFEVQAYHFSFPNVRTAALKHKKAVRDGTRICSRTQPLSRRLRLRRRASRITRPGSANTSGLWKAFSASRCHLWFFKRQRNEKSWAKGGTSRAQTHGQGVGSEVPCSVPTRQRAETAEPG